MAKQEVTYLTVPIIFLKEAPSGKAFRCILLDEEGGKEVARKWLPFSQVKTEDGERVEAEYGQPVTVMIPLWIAEKEGFDKYYTELEEEEELDEVDFREDD